MIDLHTHSTYSDGTDDVINILKKAEKLHLEVLSITDHNTCAAYKELETLNIAEHFSGKIINGIELSTHALNIPIEILGYKYNPKILEPELKKLYLTPEERNKIELSRLFEKAKLAGIDINENAINEYKSDIFASKFFHNIIRKNIDNKKLIDEDAWNDNNVFYRKYMSNPSTPFYVETSDILPDISTLINLIHEANGLVFLPHIFEYNINSLNILNHILTTYKIDGIECFYTTFSNEQNKYLLNICKEKNLFVSGGSDFHGSYKPNVNLGTGFGTLNISKKYVENWI